MKLSRDPMCQIAGPNCTRIATEVDHIIPRSRRPDLNLTWSNLQSACRTCNLEKGDGENSVKMSNNSDGFRAQKGLLSGVADVCNPVTEGIGNKAVTAPIVENKGLVAGPQGGVG